LRSKEKEEPYKNIKIRPISSVNPKSKKALTHSQSEDKEGPDLNNSITNIHSAVARYEEVHESYKSGQDRVLITGDDILIEYTERLMNALKQVNELSLKQPWR